MSCTNCNKVKIECGGERIYAPCVYVEIDFPTYSQYNEEDCVTLDGVVTELYEEIGNIKDEINIEDFTPCLEYDEITIPNILQKHEDKLCENPLANVNPCDILDMDISECGIDVSCLGVDVCNNTASVTTIGNLFQTLINRICELENQQ